MKRDLKSELQSDIIKKFETNLNHWKQVFNMSDNPLSNQESTFSKNGLAAMTSNKSSNPDDHEQLTSYDAEPFKHRDGNTI